MSWKLTDSGDKDSLACDLRRRRFALFLDLLEQLPRPLRILDVGGTYDFWETMGASGFEHCSITLLNMQKCRTGAANFTSVVGDARQMPQFEDDAFDVVFSNSVIEHVGGLDDQFRMAAEIRRVGRFYFVQTPNRYFPVEPHFQFPCFQFLPRFAQLTLLKRFALGAYPRAGDDAQAEGWIDEIRLLSRNEFARMFPEARIVSESFWGLTKSFMAIYDPRARARTAGEFRALQTAEAV